MGTHFCDGQLNLYDVLEESTDDVERYLYLEISRDQFEIPIFVCDSIEELSDKTGVSVGRIRDLIKKAESRGGSSRFVRVRINET